MITLEENDPKLTISEILIKSYILQAPLLAELLNLPGKESLRQLQMNQDLDSCHITQACQFTNNMFMPESHHRHRSTNFDSHLMPSNSQFNVRCTNYDPSAKPNGCRTKIPLMSNFNVNAFLGKWYFLANYNFGQLLSGLGCGTDVFTLNGNSLTLTTTIYSTNGSSNPFNIPLDLNTFKSAEMKFNFNGNNDVRIVSTDYTNYVIWYNCGTSSTGQAFERIEVAVRSPTSISASTLRTITNELNRVGFNICQVGFVGRSICPRV